MNATCPAARSLLLPSIRDRFRLRFTLYLRSLPSLTVVDCWLVCGGAGWSALPLSCLFPFLRACCACNVKGRLFLSRLPKGSVPSLRALQPPLDQRAAGMSVGLSWTAYNPLSLPSTIPSLGAVQIQSRGLPQPPREQSRSLFAAGASPIGQSRRKRPGN